MADEICSALLVQPTPEQLLAQPLADAERDLAPLLRSLAHAPRVELIGVRHPPDERVRDAGGLPGYHVEALGRAMDSAPAPAIGQIETVVGMPREGWHDKAWLAMMALAARADPPLVPYPIRAVERLRAGVTLSFHGAWRRRIGYLLGYEAGIAAGTTDVFLDRAGSLLTCAVDDLDAVCPAIEEPGAFSILLNLRHWLAWAVQSAAADVPGWFRAEGLELLRVDRPARDLTGKADRLDRRLRAAANRRAEGLHDDARIALNALLLTLEFWRDARETRPVGFHNADSWGASWVEHGPWLLASPPPARVYQFPRRLAEAAARVAVPAGDAATPAERALADAAHEAAIERVLGELHAEVCNLDRLHHGRGEIAEHAGERRRVYGRLERAGLFGDPPDPDVIDDPALRDRLLAAPRFARLPGFTTAAATLRAYYASDARRDLLGALADGVPASLWRGPVSIDWFRSPRLSTPPDGFGSFEWLATCEHHLHRWPGLDGRRDIEVHERGRWYRLLIRIDDERPAVWGYRPFDPSAAVDSDR